MKNLSDLGLELSGNFGAPNKPSRRYDLNLMHNQIQVDSKSLYEQNVSKSKTPRIQKISIL